MKHCLRYCSVLIFSTVVALCGAFAAHAQSGTSVVIGILTDTTNTPIPGASAAVLGKEGKILTGGITDSRGRFTIRAVPQGDLTLRIHSIGYDTVRRAMKVVGDTVRLGTLRLRQNAITTELVEVEAVQERGQQRGDTTEFNAKAFKTDANASADEMIRKMPGIEVENGQVRAQGENVRRVLVDGKPFFGDDPNTTLKNIPSDMIDKVQVYNQMSDQSQFTGFDDGDRSKTLNIVTREDRRKGQFGKIYAGYGGLDQVQDRYTAGGTVNFFNGDQRISVLALSNNINQQNFSIADILGTMGGGGMMMRMAGAMGGSQAQMWMSRRGGGGNSGGGDGGSGIQNFLVNNQDGITRSHGLGINYSDQFGKSVSVSGSYFFNNTNNNTLQSIKRQNFLAGTATQLNDQSTDNTQGNTNHRLNLRADFQIDSLSSILVTPRLTWQSNDRTGTTATSTTVLDTLLNKSDARNISDNRGYNLGGDILYRKRFETQGRTFSANLSTTIRNNDASQENISENEFLFNGQRLAQLFRQDIPSLGRNATYSANLNYTEPIAKNQQLQFGYNLSIQNSRSERQLYNFDTVSQRYSDLNTRLSNNSESEYIRHRPGITYRFTLEPERDTTKPQANPAQMMSMFGMGSGGGMRPPAGMGGMDMGNVGAWVFSIGADYQYATLGVTQTFPGAFDSRRTFVNVLPSLTISTRPAMTSNLRLTYRASTNQPSIGQLQDVVDNTDPLRLSSGNPTLNQEFTHNINANYGSFNVVTAGGFFTNISFSATENKIVNSTTISRDTSTRQPNGGVLPPGSQFTRPVNVNGYVNANWFGVYSFPWSPVRGMKLNFSVNGFVNYTRDISLINSAENIGHTWILTPSLNISSNISENTDFGLSFRTSVNSVSNTIQQQLDQTSYTHTVSARGTFILRDSSDWLDGWLLTGDLGYTITRGLASGFNQTVPLLNIGIGKRFWDNRGELKIQAFDGLNQNNAFSRNVGTGYIEDTQTNVLRRYFMLSFTYNLRRF